MIKFKENQADLTPDPFDKNYVVDGLLGQAVGDAFGVPVEFLSRKQVRRINLRDMEGRNTGIRFSSRWGDLIPAGAWSDDTSMAVAAMASIINHNGQIDYEDIMKQFINWWEGGKYTSLDNFPFGLGATVDRAFNRYKRHVPALQCGGLNFSDNGNGALMRMFPFSMYCIMKNLPIEETMEIIHNASSITHGHEISVLSCLIYTIFLNECISLKDPRSAYRNAVQGNALFYKEFFSADALKAHDLLFNEVQKSDFDADRIPESGYVVDSLTTAIYSMISTDNYEDAIRMAVNFGYDTDTNAAITGSIAGALYGKDQIPDRWLNALRKKDELIKIANDFVDSCKRPQS